MFGGKEKERHFDRTDVSTTETILSWGVLGLLATVGVLVAILGRNVDTDLFTASIAGTSDARVAESVEPTTAPAIATSKQQSAGGIALDGIAPASWSQYGTTEFFTADTLYEKINGRAEQYLAYEVATLECASFANDSGQYVDVYLYTMQSALNAFGIYSVERSPDGVSLSIADRSYRSGTGIFLWQGDHYAQIIGSDGTATVSKTVDDIATRIAGDLAPASVPPWGLALLPKAGMVTGSTQFYRKDALGLDYLPETFLARYAAAEEPVTLFISRAENETNAGAVLDSYREYAEMFGQAPEETDRIWVCDLGGVFDAVFDRGIYIGGTTAVPNRNLAIERARALLSHLETSP